jgi:hypothetical protein
MTQMRIRSERLFHELLSRALSDTTVTVMLEGDMTIAVPVPLCTSAVRALTRGRRMQR